ncbi:MAG: flippase-like domain-containing protein [Candidatus Thermoplasmatota archaeon]
MNKDKKSRNVKISITISITLSIGIIVAILLLTVTDKTLDQLSKTRIKYEFFFLAVLLNMLYWVLWGARVKTLANAVDKNVKIGLWGSTKMVLANLFLACITPSAAGGEPVRIYLLNKHGLSSGSATAVALGERLIDAVFILVSLPFAVLIIKKYINVDYIRVGLSVGVVFFILCIMLFALSIKYPEKTKSVLISINMRIKRLLKRDRAGEDRIIKIINREVDNFHNSMILFLTTSKKSFIKASIITVFFWFTGFLIPSMILLGLGFQPFIVESFSAQIILLLIVMMPTTPGGAGVTELGVAGLYSLLIGSSMVGVFVLLFRLITYHMNLIAGSIFQYRIFRSITSFSLEAMDKKT